MTWPLTQLYHIFFSFSFHFSIPLYEYLLHTMTSNIASASTPRRSARLAAAPPSLFQTGDLSPSPSPRAPSAAAGGKRRRAKSTAQRSAALLDLDPSSDEDAMDVDEGQGEQEVSEIIAVP